MTRRIYNANVHAYDSLCQTFPSLLIARQFHFVAATYFQVEPAVRDAGPPTVDLPGPASARLTRPPRTRRPGRSPVSASFDRVCTPFTIVATYPDTGCR